MRHRYRRRVRDHTSLKAWQEARAVSLGVLDAGRVHWKPWASALFSQLQRASLSVQLNIAEGYTFTESARFTNHLGIAYGSAVETGELLELARVTNLIPESQCEVLIRDNRLCQRLLLGMLKKRRITSR